MFIYFSPVIWPFVELKSTVSATVFTTILHGHLVVSTRSGLFIGVDAWLDVDPVHTFLREHA